MNVNVEVRKLRLARTFRISHTTLEHIDVVVLHVRRDAIVGTGEVAVGPWTDIRSSAIAAEAHTLASTMSGPGSWPSETVLDALLCVARERGCPATVRLLVEMAFLDGAGKRAGLPVWRLLGLPPPPGAGLWRTLSLGDPPPADGPRRYKVKLGGASDEQMLSRLQQCGAEVIVDVNGGWDHAAWRRAREPLQRVSLVALEDPVSTESLLPAVRRALPRTPVILDQSVCALSDIDRVGRHADGANVKLGKFGGILDSRRALLRLHAHGLRRMLGCYIEPPRAIAYAAQLAGLADWTDLDGHTWLVGDHREDVLRLDSSEPGVPRIAAG